MYRILVVDDEVLICDGIQSMLERIGHPAVSQVRTAYSAEEALACLDDYQPHILLTDIRMPGMSGIRLIAEATGHLPELKCIVLSGYDEFHYAKEAFTMGAVDYLLKPASMRELRSVLKKSILMLEEALEKKALTALQEYRALQKAFQDAFLILIDAAPGSEEALGSIRKLEALRRNHCWTVFMLGFRGHHRTTPDQDIGAAMLEHNFNYGSINGLLIFGFVMSHSVCAAVINHGSDIERDLRTQYFRSVEQVLSKHLSFDVCLASAGTSRRAEDLPRLVERGLNLISYRLVLGYRLLWDAEAILGRTDTPPGLTKALSNAKGAWERQDYEGFSHGVDRLFGPEFIDRITIQGLEEVYQRVLTDLRSAVAEYDRELENRLRRGLLEFDSIHEVRITMKDLGYRILQGLRHPKISSISELAMKYVRQNYHKSIDMAMAANSVGMSYSYFSKVFKDETGRNFSDFVMEVRMTEAARNFSDPASKIHEVAGRVGYDNPKHFTRAFKNYFGISPMEYKKRRGEE